MTEYALWQVVKGKNPPAECPEGFYWRKSLGVDEFKLYPKKARKRPEGRDALDGVIEKPPASVKRVAAGVRFYMQHEEGFKQVVDAANLSVKALQNLAMWANAAATVKAEREKVRLAAVAKANAALKDAGLMIGPDGTVQPIPAA